MRSLNHELSVLHVKLDAHRPRSFIVRARYSATGRASIHSERSHYNCDALSLKGQVCCLLFWMRSCTDIFSQDPAQKLKKNVVEEFNKPLKELNTLAKGARLTQMKFNRKKSHLLASAVGTQVCIWDTRKVCFVHTASMSALHVRPQSKPFTRESFTKS